MPRETTRRRKLSDKEFWHQLRAGLKQQVRAIELGPLADCVEPEAEPPYPA